MPGPAGLWKRSKFIEIFGKHPSLPFGEDIFGGFTTLNSGAETVCLSHHTYVLVVIAALWWVAGYCIRTENRCMVTTFAPPILMNLGGQSQFPGSLAVNVLEDPNTSM